MPPSVEQEAEQKFVDASRKLEAARKFFRVASSSEATDSASRMFQAAVFAERPPTAVTAGLVAGTTWVMAAGAIWPLTVLVFEEDTGVEEPSFAEHVRAWKDEVAFSSSLTEMVENRHYQAIIQMGARAIPLLLAELRREPDHWGPALAAITGENPLHAEDAGDLEAITRRWLAWGTTLGY